MSYQDWTPVVLNASTSKKTKVSRESDVNRAIQSGAQVESVKKHNAGHNSQHRVDANIRKLEDPDNDELRHETVPVTLARKIQQGRQAKGWSQKDLAQRINEKATVVNDYEGGRAIPNNQIIQKMERALGCRLR